MVKKMIWVLAAVVIGVIIYVGYMIFEDFSSTVDDRENEVESVEDVNSNNTNNETSETNTDDEHNPFGDSNKQEDLTDVLIRNYIHEMSHQKVVADVKWGFYEITDDRINWLLESLDIADVSEIIRDEFVYRDILTRWINGNFSQIDKDHNDIWNLQGGTIGKATGILSEEEERKFIESQK